MHAGRQSKRGLRFLLELQIKRRQCRAQTERSCCKQHVLHRRVDGRAGRAGRGASFQARDNPDGSLMDVCGQIFCYVEQPPGSCQGRVHQPDTWCNLLVPCPLIVGPTVCLITASLITRKRQRCMFPPFGAQTPASRIFRISSFGTGSGFSRRIDRVVRMISNRSAVSGMVCSVMSSLAAITVWSTDNRRARSSM